MNASANSSESRHCGKVSLKSLNDEKLAWLVAMKRVAKLNGLLTSDNVY
jgi:hypothetical protein